MHCLGNLCPFSKLSLWQETNGHWYLCVDNMNGWETYIGKLQSLLSTIIVRDKVVYLYRPIGFLTVHIYEPISDRLDIILIEYSFIYWDFEV